ncbi:MAG: hypothetical protein ACOZDY_12280 [Pseudomonadota bacterium]
MRPRLNSRSVTVFAAMVAATLVAGIAAAEPGLPEKSTSADGVTVKAVPRTVSGPEWLFEIVFDTHSRDLADDPVSSSILIADGRESRPKAWKGDPPGGHHRKGMLVFAAPAERPAKVELQLQRPGESGPRRFAWDLK